MHSEFDEQEAAVCSLMASPEWTDAVGELIRRTGSSRFPVALHTAAGCLCEFDSLIVTAYSGTSRPHSLYHDLDEVQATISISFYETGPYLLDPFYLANRRQLAPGVYRLVDIAPKAFFESEYYRTFYRRIRLSDEMGLLIREPSGRCFIVSLARRVRRPKFSGFEVAAMNAGFGILSAAVLRNWADSERSPDRDDVALQERLSTFGSDVLSRREMEVIQMVLQGHSTPSAAIHLGIAEGTVKVHRRHAYAKLGIGSQAELFSAATRYLAESGQ